MDQKEKSSVIKELLNTSRETLQEVKKINNKVESTGISYSQMLVWLSQHKMYQLSPRQIYYMVERGDDINFIKAISGYSEDEIKKKYSTHKKNNVYR